MATHVRSGRPAPTTRAPRRARARRRRLPPAQRRAEILQATEIAVARHGYQGTTVPRINAVAGVAQGSFYRYFRDVDDALLELLRVVLDPLSAAAAELNLSHVHDVAELEAELLGFFLIVAEQLEKRAAFIHEALLVAPAAQGPVGREMRAFLARMRDRARGLLESRAGTAPFRPSLDPQIAAAAIVGMILGAAREAADLGGAFEPRRWAGEMARLEAGALARASTVTRPTRRRMR